MSAITSDWAPSAADSPTGHSAKAGKTCCRELEFRSALDSYVADYRKHLAVTIPSSGFRTRPARFIFFQRFVELLRR